MSDDDTLEELLEDEELADELDEDLFPEVAAAGDDAGEEAEAEDELFDDENEEEATAPAEEEAAPVSLDASEDGDDELDTEPAVDLGAIEGLDVDDPIEVADEVEGDVDDTIRDGEFVCSSCHMAKRSSALADADEQLCRDCV